MKHQNWGKILGELEFFFKCAKFEKKNPPKFENDFKWKGLHYLQERPSISDIIINKMSVKYLCTRYPGEELLYITLSNIVIDFQQLPTAVQVDGSVQNIQIDTQVISSNQGY